MPLPDDNVGEASDVNDRALYVQRNRSNSHFAQNSYSWCHSVIASRTLFAEHLEEILFRPLP